MDPAVGDQRLQRPPGDLAADRIEAGDDDRVRRVVDDDVHAGRQLERADVPPLAADDPPLHLVVGQRDRGHGGLRRVLGRDALDGERDDRRASRSALALGLLPDVAGQCRRLGPGFVLHLAEDLLPRLLGAEPGDPLQPAPLVGDQPLEVLGPFGLLAVALLERGEPGPGLAFAVLQLAGALVEGPLPLLDPALEPLPLLAAPAHLLVELAPQAGALVAGLAQDLLPVRFGLAGALGHDLFGLGARRGQDAAGGPALDPDVEEEGQTGDDYTGHDPLEEGQQEGLEHLIYLRTPRLGAVVSSGTGGYSTGERLPLPRPPRRAGGISRFTSSTSVVIRAAASRSPRRAWNNSSVMASAARIAALCGSTAGIRSRIRCSELSR